MTKKKTKTKNSTIKQSKMLNIKIPKITKLSAQEKINIYKEEILKKDRRITELEQENKLLLDLSMKNAKKRLDELEHAINNK